MTPHLSIEVEPPTYASISSSSSFSATLSASSATSGRAVAQMEDQARLEELETPADDIYNVTPSPAEAHARIEDQARLELAGLETAADDIYNVTPPPAEAHARMSQFQVYPRPSSPRRTAAVPSTLSRALEAELDPARPDFAREARHFASPAILHSFGQFSRSGEFSDLEIISSGVSFSVHRIIISAESPFLAAVCRSLDGGKRPHQLDLSFIDPETLERVIDWCYSRAYNDGEYPDHVPSWLSRMTPSQLQEALQVPPGSWDDAVHTKCPVPSSSVEDEDETDTEHEDEKSDVDSDVWMDDFEGPLEYDSESDLEEEDVPDLKHHRNAPLEVERGYKLSLITNLKVYVVAMELQMPALQLLARERFVATATTHWQHYEHLDKLVEQLYRGTTAADPVRAFMCRLVAAHYHSAQGPLRETLRGLMGTVPEFARDVLDCSVQVMSGSRTL